MNKFKEGDLVEAFGVRGRVITVDNSMTRFQIYVSIDGGTYFFTKEGRYVLGGDIVLKHVEETKDLISESLQKENKELKDRIRQLEDRISRVRSIFNEDFRCFMEGASNE